MSVKVASSVGVAIILALAACGGGSSGAAKIHADAGEEMAALSSYHVTLEIQAVAFSQTIEFDLVPPDRVRSTETFTGGEESFEYTIVAIGDESYFRPPDSPDFFIASEEDFFEGFPDMLAFTVALFSEVSDLTNLDEEMVDGASAHHLRGTLTPAALEFIEPFEQHTEGVVVDVWIGVEDSLVRRVVWMDADRTVTLTLSRFNEVSVEAPANPRPAAELEAEQLVEAIEFLSAEQQECLRRALGDAAFDEFVAGTRLPTEEELRNGEVCFAFESPEDVGRAFGSLSAEEADCLRGVLGDTVFEELAAGARLPTAEEFQTASACFNGEGAVPAPAGE